MIKKKKELDDTIDLLVRDVPKTINKKLKIRAVKKDTNVSLEVVDVLKKEFNK